MSVRTDSPSLDVPLDALSDSYRRRILTAVSDHDPRDKNEFVPADFATDDEDLEELRAILHHAHLPKLTEYGYIERAPDTGTIRRGPKFDEIAPLLDLMVEYEDELPADWP